MTPINKALFLMMIDEIDEEKPRYRLGGWAKDGTCDCIGLIIGALRRGGGAWGGIHGSNWAARNAMNTLEKLTSATQLKPGMLVYRIAATNAKLPDRYRRGGTGYNGDEHDYCHVGVVRSVDPLVIVHCTSPTVKHASTRKGWQVCGWPAFLTDVPKHEVPPKVKKKKKEAAE